MLKQLTICAALAILGAGPILAQQEATLQRIEVRGAAFDVVVATAKAQGARFDLGMSPDALILHLAGGELALGFDSAEKMLKELDTFRRPGCGLLSAGRDGKSHQPVAIYIVPKDE
jgi:hypothetical protein